MANKKYVEIPFNQWTQDLYQQLVDDLNVWSDQYYNHARSVVTDAEFDAAYDILKQLEYHYPDWVVKTSPTQRVGYAVTDLMSSRKIMHAKPMLSLAKMYTYDDLYNFVRRCSGVASADEKFYVDYKLDGLSCELMYKNGQLCYAATRGDGYTGKNVTSVAIHIPNISTVISQPGIVYVRGEVVIHNTDFADINQILLIAEKEQYTTTRNAAAGILQREKDDTTFAKMLRFYAWEYLEFGKPTYSFEEQAEKIDQLGFSRPNGKLCNGITEVQKCIDEITQERKFLPYEIDGIVIKANNPKVQNELGANHREPFWAAAWKFNGASYPTTVTDIAWTIGRTGKFTPVVNLEPININGVEIKNVSAYNAATVVDMGLGPGAKVMIKRSGDVIPTIDKCVVKAENYSLPTECPHCHQPLSRVSVDLVCTNPDCPGILKAQLKHIVCRDVLNVRGVGDAIIDDAVDSGTISSIQDLFVPLINKSDNIKSASLIDLSIRVRNINLHELFQVLNIPNVGRVVASKVAMLTRSLDNFIAQLDSGEFKNMTISDSAKKSIIQWYSVPRNKELLKFVAEQKLPRLS